jgi:GxxExxY protein
MALIDNDEINNLTQRIIGAAIEVHRTLGAGLLESVYERCLVHELSVRGMRLVRRLSVPIRYKGILLESSLELDLLVNETVVIEVKSVSALAFVHKSQLITYLKLTGYPIGLLINFNVPVLKDGIRRLVNTSAFATKPSPETA